jgi:hypothetical protein
MNKERREKILDSLVDYATMLAFVSAVFFMIVAWFMFFAHFASILL